MYYVPVLPYILIFRQSYDDAFDVIYLNSRQMLGMTKAKGLFIEGMWKSVVFIMRLLTGL